MERMNLLPDDLAFSWKNRLLYAADRQFSKTLLRSLGAVLILEIFLLTGQTVLIRGYASRKKSLEAQQVALASQLQREKMFMEKLKAREGQLASQIAWHDKRERYLRSYRTQGSQFQPVLREVKRVLPYGVWLMELEATPEGKLRMVGGAFDEDLVTQFMGELKVAPRFTEVAFNFTKKDKVGQTIVVQFEVTCQVVEEKRSG